MSVSKNTLSQRLADSFMILSVSVVSILLLLYVAYGTARRTYEDLLIDKMVAQGELIQSRVEDYVRPGLPIRNFVGFSGLADPMVEADKVLDSAAIYDTSGSRIFVSGARDIPLLLSDTSVKIANDRALLSRSDRHIQIILPLKNRFETAGHLALTMPYDSARSRVDADFERLLMMGAAASALLALFVFFASARGTAMQARQLGGAFTVMFVMMSVFVVSMLIGIYSEGAQEKGRGLAKSLGQRLDDVVTYKLNIEEIDGIDQLFRQYIHLNPEIHSVALTINGRITVHNDPALVGSPWVRNDKLLEHAVDLNAPESPRHAQVIVTSPRNIVYAQVARSVKNFAALFVASGFLAYLFMQVARAVHSVRREDNGLPESERQRAAVTLVQPAFFIGVFIEHLTYAFLPQYMHGLAANASLGSSFASAPFVLYYLAFALVLVPAGRMEVRTGPKPLIVGGLLLAALGFAAMVMTHDFMLITLARCLSGLGQGILFIGAQSYVLEASSADRKTRGAAVIVFAFQSAMISGMAIGSLLVSEIDTMGVFALGAMVAAAGALYAIVVLPKLHAAGPGAAVEPGKLWRDVGKTLTDGQFIRTFAFIGAPAKAVLTGVMLFGLPLILSKMGFRQEDIGQFTMIYAGAVILASGYAAALADREGGTEGILFWGALLAALGLATLSSLGTDIVSQSSEVVRVGVILAGVAIVGFAHGFVNAPVVTHVANARVSSEIGASAVAATYRFLERAGHTAGPIIMGQLFALAGVSTDIIAWIAGGTLMMGLLFLAHSKPTPTDEAAGASKSAP